MERLRNAFVLTLVLCASQPAVSPASSGFVFQGSNASPVSLPELIQDLRRARVVFLGEEHGNREHHAAQLAVIRALADSGARVSVGLEMFRADAQAKLDLWVGGGLDQHAFYGLYADHWAAGLWPRYSDLFYYARQQGLPLVGLNVSRALVAQVAREGFLSLDSRDRDRLGVVRCDVDERYQRVLALVLGRKDQESESFWRFCEAQVVWDTAMARNALRHLEAHPDRTLVVLAGTFHAWKHGIPEQFGRLSGLPFRVILPATDESFLRYDVVLEDADYVWWQE